MANVTVLDLIVLPFLHQLPCGLQCGLTAFDLEILIGENIGRNEPPLEVRMDHSGSLWSLVPPSDGPSAHLIVTSCKKMAQIQRIVASFNDMVSHGSLGSQLLEGGRTICLRHRGDLLLQCGTKNDDLGVWVVFHLPLSNRRHPLALQTNEILLVKIHQVRHRLGGQEIIRVQQRHFIRGPQSVPDWLAVLQDPLNLFQQRYLGLEILALGSAVVLLFGLQTLSAKLQVLSQQLGRHRRHISHRVHGVLQMHHIRVCEGAQNVEETIDRNDVRHKLHAHTLALRGTVHDTCCVVDRNLCRHLTLRLVPLEQVQNTLIGHVHRRRLGVGGVERHSRGLALQLGQCIPGSCLARVWNADNSKLQIVTRPPEWNLLDVIGLLLRSHGNN
mmetsp:Transcript_10918/g.23844  ORF Transcript_10918/g.23844 Transcript_10918/m.23844 type:complete len:386 (+) Transcript_10918:316-1473(+)